MLRRAGFFRQEPQQFFSNGVERLHVALRATQDKCALHAREGSYGDGRGALTAALMRWEKVPAIALFRDNTAAFVHELAPDSFATSAGDNTYVRVDILTPVGVLDRDNKIGVVREMTDIVAAAAGDPTLVERTWVLVSEAPDGGWGIDGRALTNAEIGAAAKSELAR